MTSQQWLSSRTGKINGSPGERFKSGAASRQWHAARVLLTGSFFLLLLFFFLQLGVPLKHTDGIELWSQVYSLQWRQLSHPFPLGETETVQYLSFGELDLCQRAFFAPHAAVRLGSNSAAPSLMCFCAALLLDISQTQRLFTVGLFWLSFFLLIILKLL